MIIKAQTKDGQGITTVIPDSEKDETIKELKNKHKLVKLYNAETLENYL